MGRKHKTLGNFQFCRDSAGVLHRIMQGKTLKTKRLRPEPEPPVQRRRRSAYLSAVETLVKVVFSFEPRPCTTAMIATEMPAALRPYSMAVAPDSSFTNFKRFFIFGSIGPQQWLSERGSGAVIVGLVRNRGANVSLPPCGEVNIGSETRSGGPKK